MNSTQQTTAANKKILVTGGAGLVGNELIKQLLAKSKPIIATYNNALININSPFVELIHCDILDVIRLEEIMNNVDEVYHCAAIVSFDPKDRAKLFKVNVEGTANVVNAALNAGVRKMVHVSSVAAIGKTTGNLPISEAVQWKEEGASNYSKSKFHAEMEVWRGNGEGLETVIVNPSIILGGSNWNNGSTKLFKTYYNEFPWYTTGINGFVDVRDVATAMIALMDSNINNQRFILSAENRSYKEIFDLIADGFGKRRPHKEVTPFISGLAWRLGKIKQFFTGESPLITKETATTALHNSYYDNKKILESVPGFTFRKTEDTISDICAELKIKYDLK